VAALFELTVEMSASAFKALTTCPLTCFLPFVSYGANYVRNALLNLPFALRPSAPSMPLRSFWDSGLRGTDSATLPLKIMYR
jgi:hypothetical protein